MDSWILPWGKSCLEEMRKPQTALGRHLHLQGRVPQASFCGDSCEDSGAAAPCPASVPPTPSPPQGPAAITPRTNKHVGAVSPRYRNVWVQHACSLHIQRPQEPRSKAPFISEGRWLYCHHFWKSTHLSGPSCACFSGVGDTGRLSWGKTHPGPRLLCCLKYKALCKGF